MRDSHHESEIAKLVQQNADLKLRVEGHTDNQGNAATNQALSEKRAQAVVDYLVRAGLPASRFTAVGYGSARPVATNDTDEGKAQNRRIEFVVKE